MSLAGLRRLFGGGRGPSRAKARSRSPPMNPETGIVSDNNGAPSTLNDRTESPASGRGGKGSVYGGNITTTASSRPGPQSNGRIHDETFKAKCRRELDRTRSLCERIKAAQMFAVEIDIITPEALDVLWEMAEDMTTEAAPLEARRAGFTLLKASAALAGTFGYREKYYEMITIPTAPSEVGLQIAALKRLTVQGQNLSPFESDLILFLNRQLRDLFPAVEGAREKSRKTKADAEAEVSDAANSGPEVTKRPKKLLEEEMSLRGLFYFVEDIINNNPKAFYDAQLEIMIGSVTSIAKRTIANGDIHGVVKIFQAVALHEMMPLANIKSCVGVLCSVIGDPTFKFGEEAWNCVRSLLQASEKLDVYQVLLKNFCDFLKHPGLGETSTPKSRGSLLSIKRMAALEDAAPLLLTNFDALVSGLGASYAISAQLELDTLRTITSLLGNDKIVHHISGLGWGVIRNKLDKILGFANKRTKSVGSDSPTGETKHSSPIYHFIYNETALRCDESSELAGVLHLLADRIVALLEGPWATISGDRAVMVLNVLLCLGRYASSVWESVIDLMSRQGLLNPSNDNDWELNFTALIEIVLLDASKPDNARCSVLQLFAYIQPLIRNNSLRMKQYASLLRLACQRLETEQDMPASVVNSLADIAAVCASDVDQDALDDLVTMIEEKAKLASFDSTASTIPPNRISDCLIQAFLTCVQQSGPKTIRLYKSLLLLTASPQPTDVRLKVMKLLTRLRCNADYAVEIVDVPDSQGLAAALCRTEATAHSQESTQPPSNRASMQDQFQMTRIGRSSVVDSSRQVRSRSATRSLNGKDRITRPTLPLWMYDGSTKGLPIDPPIGASPVVHSKSRNSDGTDLLDLAPWLDSIIDVLQLGADWEIYSYILVHLPSQLSNYSLFAIYVKQLQTLQNLAMFQLNDRSFYEPPTATGIKKGDVALCLYHTLTTLLAYHECFGRRELDSTVRVFRLGIKEWDRTGTCCIHALALCCHEIPTSVQRQIIPIITMMQERITRANLAMDILEFLGGLARLPDAYGSTDVEFYQTVFAICVRYLQHAREQRQNSYSIPSTRSSTQLSRQSGNSGEPRTAVESTHSNEVQRELLEYVYMLAYQVIEAWFLSIDVRERGQHVGWLTKELAWRDQSGKQVMEEQSLVVLDMMHRTAYSNLGETEANLNFADPEKTVVRRMWLVGMSIVTVEIEMNADSSKAGLGQLTKRQASGTTHAIYYHHTATLPSHHVKERNTVSGAHLQAPFEVYPNHMFLQLASTIAPVPAPLQPISLPDDEFTKRAIRNFDRTDTVDGHKAGVIYIGQGQCLEADILSNSQSTDAYQVFLSGLGTKVTLKDAVFNPQGLDTRGNTDGMHTYAWRDRVTEIVFHVTTMMPTDCVDDPQGIRKKKHIGNDHVKIIFNDSGRLFNVDTFQSEFNNVNIVITPEANLPVDRLITDKTQLRKDRDSTHDVTDTERFGHYKVQTLCSPDFPQISSAPSPKVVSAEALPAFVRHLALNASVFSQVWELRGQDEYVSSWRVRLREIMKLRQRYANTNTSANQHYPESQAEAVGKSYNEGDTWMGFVAMGGMAEQDLLSKSLDFTRWT